MKKKLPIAILTATFILLSVFAFSQAGGVSISPTGASPDPSAALDIQFNNKGTLVTRLTTSQRDSIANPATGLLIYNTTTNCFNTWVGNSWKYLCPNCGFNDPIVTNNGPVCQGNTLNLTASPIGGATYLWTGPNGFSSTQQNPSVSNFTVSDTGTYTVVATVNGCSSNPQSTLVSGNTTPATPGTISGIDSVCPNTMGVVYSINSVNGATSYNWTLPPGASITANADTTITVSFGANPVGNITVSAANNCGTSAQSTFSITQPAICSPMAFSYTGSNQSFTVPAGVTSITVKLWGAGGGGNREYTDNSGASISSGGGGAFLSGTLSVTPGQVLGVIVGQAGFEGTVSAGTYGGGGGSGGQPDCSTGGGRSALQIANNDIVTAGGGGGGAYVWLISADNNWGNGGGGGATTGSSGVTNQYCSTEGGGGGTTTSGGAAGNGCDGDYGAAGSQYTGGNSAGSGDDGIGGAGGGGYYGGGSGSSYYGGGGGGGSSYYPASGFALISNVAGATVPGGTPGPAAAGGNTDPNYQAGSGVGGYGTTAAETVGGNGYIIISW